MLILRGAEDPLLGGGYMRPTMPIFELGRGCLDKSHVWKLPDLNIATNPWKFHHSTTKTVVKKLFTNKQTNIGENNTSSTSLTEIIMGTGIFSG